MNQFGSDQLDPRAALGAGLAGLAIYAIVMIAILIFFLWVWGRIFKKAGYSPWLALLFLIPFANVVMILWFAFATWPIERRAAGTIAAPAAGYAAPQAYAPPPAQQPPAQPAPAAPAYAPPVRPPVAPPQPPAPGDAPQAPPQG